MPMPVSLPQSDLRAVDAKIVRDICERFGVVKLGVFGSIARGEAKIDSDVDVLVEFEPGRRYSLLTLGELRDALSPAFEERAVDLCTSPQLHPDHRERVIRDLRVLYAL